MSGRWEQIHHSAMVAGDRVRLTLEGEMTAEGLYLTNGADRHTVPMKKDNLLVALCVSVERQVPPVKVGCAVSAPDGECGEVIGIDDGVAWVKFDHGGRGELLLDALQQRARPGAPELF
jgi:hypothetical protein